MRYRVFVAMAAPVCWAKRRDEMRDLAGGDDVVMEIDGPGRYGTSEEDTNILKYNV